jgi:prepilin-type N-terminal cleavage/methylation domain-containing protein
MTRRFTTKWRGSHGLTLVEILVALSLVAIVLLPVVIGLSQALVSTSQSTLTAAATSIARDKMEQVKAGARRSDFDFASMSSEPRVAADLKAGDSFFEVEVVVETIRPDDDSRSGLNKVAVSVYQAGTERPITTLTTYFTPAGI